MKREIAVFLALMVSLLFSCDTPRKNELRSFFKENFREFETLRALIGEQYLFNSLYDERNTLVIMSCKKYSMSTVREICDEKLAELLSNLNLSEVRIEARECNEKSTFDKVYLRSEASGRNGTVYYLYDYCSEYSTFESDTYLDEQSKITGT